MQRDSSLEVFQLFGKGIGQPRQAAAVHAEREVLTFDVGRGDFCRHASYRLTAYCYYLSRAITPRRVFYSKVGYAVGLYDHAMRGAVTERTCRIVPLGFCAGICARNRARAGVGAGRGSPTPGGGRRRRDGWRL